MKKGGLGKKGQGINALIREDTEEIKSTVSTLKISQIEPNPNQPRKVFDIEKLQLLADSIQEHGIVQPIVVKKNDNGFYTIIAGERRWRAARIAGLSDVPVVIKDYDEKTVAEVSLIENLQREDLNPIEEALGYSRLIEEFKMTQDEVSKKVGKSRSAVTNSLRLLNLAPNVKKLVEQLEISAGHARALLAIDDMDLQEKIAYQIIEKDLSVRQIENYVNTYKKQAAAEKKEKQFKYTNEGKLMMIRYNLDEKKVDYRELLRWTSFCNAFVISLTCTIICNIPLKMYYQLAIGFVILFGLIYSIFEIVGRHLNKKWGKENGK